MAPRQRPRAMASVRLRGNDSFKQLSIQMHHINCMKNFPKLSKPHNVRPPRPCRPLLLTWQPPPPPRQPPGTASPLGCPPGLGSR